MIGRLQQQLATLGGRASGDGYDARLAELRQAPLIEQLRRERESRDRCLGQYVSIGYEIVP
jgi:hypothetical protein